MGYIEFLPGIYGLAEFLVFSDKFMKHFSNLIDDKLAVHINDFFVKAETCDIPKPARNIFNRQLEKAREYMGRTVEIKYFPSCDRIRNLVDLVKDINLSNLKYYDNTAHLKEELQWLFSNRHLWSEYIEPRKLQDFEVILRESYNIQRLLELEENTSHIFSKCNIRIYDNLIRRVQDNKEAFYSSREVRRTTHLRIFFSRSNEFTQILNGIDYLNYLHANKLSVIEGRRF